MGKLYSYIFDVELLIECALQVHGAIYDMQVFSLDDKDYLVAGINALVKVFWIECDVPDFSKISEVDS